MRAEFHEQHGSATEVIRVAGVVVDVADAR